MKIAYTNCSIYTGAKKETGKGILVNNHVIERVVDENKIGEAYTVKDLGGLNIAPAFIDLQIYGGNSKLFSAELNTVYAYHGHQYH